MIVFIFEKGIYIGCCKHRAMSLIPIVVKILDLISVRRLAPVCGSDIHEQQVGLRPGRDCIEQMFTLPQLFEVRHTHDHSTIRVYPHLKGTFDIFDGTALFSAL